MNGRRRLDIQRQRRCTDVGATTRECKNASVDLLFLDGMFPDITIVVCKLSPPPSAWTPFLYAFKLARRPATVEVSGLRSHLFIVHKALPWHTRRIEREIALDVLEWLCGRFVAPNLAMHLFAGVCCFDSPVCGSAFPLTEGRLVGDLGKGDGGREGGSRKVVCWKGERWLMRLGSSL
jgi:hypothetical protein